MVHATRPLPNLEVVQQLSPPLVSSHKRGRLRQPDPSLGTREEDPQIWGDV